MEGEQFLYKDIENTNDQILVTESQFQVGNKSYAIREIQSASVVRHSKSRVPPIVVGLIGLAIVIVSIYPLRAGGLQTLGHITFGVGAFWLGMMRRMYVITLQVSDSQTEAVRTHNKSKAFKLLAALNEATAIQSSTGEGGQGLN